jgi:hypothetical protein
VVGRLEPVKIPMLLDNDMWVILTSWRQSFSYNYIYIIYIYMDYSSPLDFIGWDRLVFLTFNAFTYGFFSGFAALAAGMWMTCGTN